MEFYGVANTAVQSWIGTKFLNLPKLQLFLYVYVHVGYGCNNVDFMCTKFFKMRKQLTMR